MDYQSIMGYASGSPYTNAPFLDIQTPEGLITMENTPIDLLGIDNLGNTKVMKAGKKKQYKFPGTQVREIPLGNPYQRGGMTSQQMFDFLFDDDDPEVPQGQNAPPTAPTTDEVDLQNQMDALNQERAAFEAQQNDALAMEEALTDFTSRRGNPYPKQESNPVPAGNPYTGEILSTGQFGNQNVGDYGKQIYGDLVNSLGYTPKVNSIFRSKSQQNALISAGKPAVKNSWHLSGNAVDLKPTDWHNLSNEQQLYFRKNYDVVYHDNHYHIEPK